MYVCLVFILLYKVKNDLKDYGLVSLLFFLRVK